MRSRGTFRRATVVCWFVAYVFTLQVVASADTPADVTGHTYESKIEPLLIQYCCECHGNELAEAEINFASLSRWSDARKNAAVWQKVREMVTNGLMPPEDAAKPNEDERRLLEEWLGQFLKIAAAESSGDPGRVTLRRLNNAEFTYTLRDLTGIDSLNVASELPHDGAAGEGFTNAGDALVMSPALVTKYIDAAKKVASHAVLLPDGFRFSSADTPRDWSDELLREIRKIYSRHTEALGGGEVDAAGTSSDPNEGGRLPLKKYLTATIVKRASLNDGDKSLEVVARQYGLNPKYLHALWEALTSSQPSPLMDPIRLRWREAQESEVAALADDIAAWQQALWKFQPIGHIGKVGGPKRWLEVVNPVVTSQEIRFKLPKGEAGHDVKLVLEAHDLGDGNAEDFVVLQNPRFVASGRPDLLLRDLRAVNNRVLQLRNDVFQNASNYLNAVNEAIDSSGDIDVVELASEHDLEVNVLRAWLEYLGIRAAIPFDPPGRLSNRLIKVANLDSVNGWGQRETPHLLANASDDLVRVPGTMKPRSIAVHPSPSHRVVVGWRSPVSDLFCIEAVVADAHHDCGNGAHWFLELRRGGSRQRLAEGVTDGANKVKVGPLKDLRIRSGDLVALSIGPQAADHGCDLTSTDLNLTSSGGESWRLATDVVQDVLIGNPHPDTSGNPNVWHFYVEPDQSADSTADIPAGSYLAQWLAEPDAAAKQSLAKQLEAFLSSPQSATDTGPNGNLYRKLASLNGPLFGSQVSLRTGEEIVSAGMKHTYGLDSNIFGRHSNGDPMEPDSLCIKAPTCLEIRLPSELVNECEFVTECAMHENTANDGAVQISVVVTDSPLEAASKDTPSPSTDTGAETAVSTTLPILVSKNGKAKVRLESALDEFRQLFPLALCYTQIVPVDEVVTLAIYYREDDHLMRLMLDPSEKEQLDRLWDELRFVSREPVLLVDVLEQLIEYATQDRDPTLFEPLRQPFAERAKEFEEKLQEAEPRHVDALIRFAARTYRRPLSPLEESDVRSLYEDLREQEIAHEEAFRLTLARVLVAAPFLYRLEEPPPGTEQGPVSDCELATRLSYFLWSSCPDPELIEVASAGKLHSPEVLLAQTRRMLRDGKIRRLATEFTCQWMQIYDFENMDEKSERHFPSFATTRGAMYEESIQFFTHIFQHNAPVLDVLDADYTFLNEQLAKHYDIRGVSGDSWRRVDGVRQYSRGGVLAQASILSKQSGASRTSPVLRGNWISEVLLGERLPRPPKGVPPLPDDESAESNMTVRQLVEKHASDPKCAVCHKRIDPFGFSLEGFDAIGRHRRTDIGNRLIDAKVVTMDGTEFDGFTGLQQYLLTKRRDAFVRQFCRKLLGYALGRAVQLSDEPLLDVMANELKANNYQVHSAVESIIQSQQFRDIRGRDVAYGD